MSKPVWDDDELIARLWQQLCAYADRKMDYRLRRKEGPEDIVQTAFRTFFRRVGKGQYSSLQGPDELLALLRTITYRKLLKHADRYRTIQRGHDREEYGMDDSLANRKPTRTDELVADELRAKALEETDKLTLAMLEEVLDRLLERHSQRRISRDLACSRYAVSRCVLHFRQQLGPSFDRVVSDSSVDDRSALGA